MELKIQSDVFRLPAPKEGERWFADRGKDRSRAPGLNLRVRKSGTRTWVFSYRWGNRPRHVMIGDAQAWPLEKARARARELHVKLDNGINPAELRRAERAAQSKRPDEFRAVVAEYLEVKRPTMKPRSYAECRRHLEQHFKRLHNLTLGSIDRAAVASRLRELAKTSGPVAADRARSTLSALFAWAVGEGICDANPVSGTNKYSDDIPRERVLSDAELAAVWKAAPEDDYGRALRMLILTGARRDEIGSLRWSEVDIDAELIKLPGERTKNRRSHEIPLSEQALDILRACAPREGRELVFGKGKSQRGYSGWSRSKRVFDERCKLKEPWTIHDLRRTVRTGLGRLGVLPHVSEAILNHLPPKLVRTYDLNKYEADKRAALDLWGEHVAALAAGFKSNVVSLRA